jgi:hypothetical protein
MVSAAPVPPVDALCSVPPPDPPEQAVSVRAAATPSATAGNFNLMVSPSKRTVIHRRILRSRRVVAVTLRGDYYTVSK